MTLAQRHARAQERKRELGARIAELRATGLGEIGICKALEDEYGMSQQRSWSLVHGKTEISSGGPAKPTPQFLRDWLREA